MSTNNRIVDKNIVVCSIDGCSRSRSRASGGSRGYCRLHYARWRRHGDALGGSTIRGAPLQWLRNNTSYDGEDCLIWPFGNSGDGRGRVHFQGRKWIASRLMCFLVHGEPPTSVHEAAHSCGNGDGNCVHPIHLRWATSKENSDDMRLHGTLLRGQAAVSAKLNEEQVKAIISLKGKKSLPEIAKDFDVSPAQISQIQNRKRWGWLEIFP